MADKYTLTYWNIPGRGESVRLMLALGERRFSNDFTPLPLPGERRPFKRGIFRSY